MFKKLVFFFILINFFYFNSQAEIVNKINISGNKRISNETITIFGDISKGSNYDGNDLNKILKNLYETNFFEDVNINLSNGILNVIVKENKIVQTIIINGIKRKKTIEELKKTLNIKEKNSFSKNLVKKDKDEITKNLKSQGYYFAKVDSLISENNNNTLNLFYNVDLGNRASIKKIKFIGNKVFKDRKLFTVITSEEDKFWKWISNKKYLDLSRMSLDKRLLENFYKNKGYNQVKILNSSAQFLNSNQFELVYNIDAGEVYTINKTKLNLPADYKKENFSDIVNNLKKLEGKKYSFYKLKKLIDAVDQVALFSQYEFVTATISEEIVDKNKINLSVNLSETEKFYVERINILGNDVTLERVIRSELVVDEGDPFNELLHAKSINNIKSRRLFSEVTTEIKEGSTPSQKIIDITVTEKPTGEISVGAGVGTSGGSFGFSVKENNFLGKGIGLTTSLELNEEQIKGEFTIVNPDYHYSGNTLFTTVESTVTDRMTNYGYESSLTGFSIGSSFEQYDNFFISPSISTYFESLKTNSTATDNLKKQEGNYFDTIGSYKLTYDKRNQRYQTSDGFVSSFSQSVPVYSDNPELRNTYEYTVYNKLSDNMITAVSFYSSAITAISSGDDVRISNRVFLPSRKLRGFELGKIGPVDSGDYVGGNYASSLNLSTTLPQMGANIQTADFKLFYDAANVWGVDYSGTVGDASRIRSAAGIGVDWFTPIGPLSFTLAQPLTKHGSDKTESFRFSLGTTF